MNPRKAPRIAEPIPDSAEEQILWAQRLAWRHQLSAGAIRKAAALPPAPRVAMLYPKGVSAGAYACMAIARESPRRKGQREPLEVGEADIWASGLALGVTLPPHDMFRGRDVTETCKRIYYAGFRAGALHALEHLRLRTRLPAGGQEGGS